MDRIHLCQCCTLMNMGHEPRASRYGAEKIDRSRCGVATLQRRGTLRIEPRRIQFGGCAGCGAAGSAGVRHIVEAL